MRSATWLAPLFWLSLAVPSVAQEVRRPRFVGDPLDPKYFERGEERKAESKAEWQRRLKAAGGHASIVPVGDPDPSKEVLLLVPGKGMNFQDAHALAKLADTYQVVIGISNQNDPLDKNGDQLATAMTQFMQYRRELGRRQGVDPSTQLRVIGHSAGGITSQIMLSEMTKRGVLTDGPESLFSGVLYVPIDTPWRGGDRPWAPWKIPAIGPLTMRVLPMIKDQWDRGSLSLINRAGSLTEKTSHAAMPVRVTTQLVTVKDPPPAKPEPFWRLVPYSNWYSSELAEGDLQKLWDFFRDGKTNLNALDSWEWGPMVRTQGLQNLLRVLMRDADYPAHEADLRSAAQEAKTLEEFGARYDAVVESIVDTFEGAHTGFMWEDPNFMPWIARVLSEWSPKAGSVGGASESTTMRLLRGALNLLPPPLGLASRGIAYGLRKIMAKREGVSSSGVVQTLEEALNPESARPR